MAAPHLAETMPKAEPMITDSGTKMTEFLRVIEVSTSVFSMSGVCSRYPNDEAMPSTEARALAVDETSRARGHDYVTLAADAPLERRVLFVTEGRDAKTIEDLQLEMMCVPSRQKEEILWRSEKTTPKISSSCPGRQPPCSQPRTNCYVSSVAACAWRGCADGSPPSRLQSEQGWLP